MSYKDNPNTFPRQHFHLVRELNRHGYAVVPAGGRMSSEIKGLAQIINEKVTALRDKARSVNSELDANLDDANEALAYANELSVALKNAVGELRGALGQQSNNPPQEETVERVKRLDKT